MSMTEWPDCPDCETDVFVDEKPVSAEVFHCHFCSTEFEVCESPTQSFLLER